jgi:hypothetical protein
MQGSVHFPHPEFAPARGSDVRPNTLYCFLMLCQLSAILTPPRPCNALARLLDVRDRQGDFQAHDTGREQQCLLLRVHALARGEAKCGRPRRGLRAGCPDDDVFDLFLQKQKIGAELHIYLEEGTYHKRLFRGPNTNDMKK